MHKTHLEHIIILHAPEDRLVGDGVNEAVPFPGLVVGLKVDRLRLDYDAITIKEEPPGEGAKGSGGG